MHVYLVPLPKIMFCGFEAYEPLPSWTPPAGAPKAGMSHANALDRAYVAGATHMARLHIDRAKAATRRLMLERTAWGAGVLVALVLGWAFSRMGW